MPTALPASARSPVLAAALLVMACDGFHAGHVSAGGAPAAMARGIDQAYAQRDACLARNATERAQALAFACARETDRLIFASGHGDAAIASAIRDDTEFRALGVVLRAPDAD